VDEASARVGPVGYRLPEAGLRICSRSRSTCASPTIAGCARTSEFAGHATCRFSAAKSEYVRGVSLVMRAGLRRLLLAYTWAPANKHEYESLLGLVAPGETAPRPRTASPKAARAEASWRSPRTR